MNKSRARPCSRTTTGGRFPRTGAERMATVAGSRSVISVWDLRGGFPSSPLAAPLFPPFGRPGKAGYWFLSARRSACVLMDRASSLFLRRITLNEFAMLILASGGGRDWPRPRQARLLVRHD